jgi:hypothetical protein
MARLLNPWMMVDANMIFRRLIASKREAVASHFWQVLPI